MKEYEVKMVLDLTNPEGANFHNSIRSLDGIKNAIADFRQKLTELKEEYDDPDNAVKFSQIQVIEEAFIEAFKSQGITV